MQIWSNTSLLPSPSSLLAPVSYPLSPSLHHSSLLILHTPLSTIFLVLLLSHPPSSFSCSSSSSTSSSLLHTTSLYIKSPPPQESAGPSFFGERGEQTFFFVIKVDRISAALRFGPPRGTAQVRRDIAFACLRRGF